MSGRGDLIKDLIERGKLLVPSSTSSELLSSSTSDEKDATNKADLPFESRLEVCIL